MSLQRLLEMKWSWTVLIAGKWCHLTHHLWRRPMICGVVKHTLTHIFTIPLPYRHHQHHHSHTFPTDCSKNLPQSFTHQMTSAAFITTLPQKPTVAQSSQNAINTFAVTSYTFTPKMLQDLTVAMIAGNHSSLTANLSTAENERTSSSRTLSWCSILCYDNHL